MLKMNTKSNLDWLFDLNKNKVDFVNYVINYSSDWANYLSYIITNLRMHHCVGVQQKFEKLGFNGNHSYVLLKSLTSELEVGLFLLNIGEKVKFLESQNAPDLVSGTKNFEKIWEVQTKYDSPYLKRLFIEGNEIISNWSVNVSIDIMLSLRLSGFIPQFVFHKYHETSVSLALKALKNFDTSILKTNKQFVLRTRDINFEIKPTTSSSSKIATIFEGGIEEMSHLIGPDEILEWIAILRNAIIKKSGQLINDIKIYESKKKNCWDSSKNFRLIALTTDADIWSNEIFFIGACFGCYDIKCTTPISDPRILGLTPSDSWYDYIRKYCIDYSELELSEPKGAFLLSDTDEIHGTLFLSSNRSPIRNFFLANPFVNFNNDPSIINYL